MSGAGASDLALRPQSVKRRLVFNFPGFEPMPAEAHIRRFVREAANVAPLYEASLAFSQPVYEDGKAAGVGTGQVVATASGEGWSTETEMVVYSLGEMNEIYDSQPFPLRIVNGAIGLIDFIFTGAALRMLWANPRYIVLYPVAYLPFLIFLAVRVAEYGPHHWGNIHFLWSIPLAYLAFWAASLYSEKKIHFLASMDNWTFARDLARRRRPDTQARLKLLYADALRRTRATGADEVVFVGHSLGAIPAIQALAGVLRAETRPTKAIRLITVGSSLLKMAFHPAATDLRSATRDIVERGEVWLDVQSRNDLMNFPGIDPARRLGFTGPGSPRLTNVRFKDQLSRETHRSIRYDVYRVHRQYLYAVEKRGPFSFHMMLLGPEPIVDVAQRGGLAESWQDRSGQTP